MSIPSCPSEVKRDFTPGLPCRRLFQFTCSALGLGSRPRHPWSLDGREVVLHILQQGPQQKSLVGPNCEDVFQSKFSLCLLNLS